jgi:hypothetical protein
VVYGLPRRATAEDHQPKGQPLHLRYSTASADSSFYIDSSFAFVLTHQVETYHSIIQRKVLAPNDFRDTAEVARTLNAFEDHYNQIAKPFQWNFTRQRLAALLDRLDHESPQDSTVPRAA